jgi:hypothetical protein
MCGIVGIDYNNISVEVYTIMWRATVSTYIFLIINPQVYTVYYISVYCLNMYLGDKPWGVISSAYISICV